MNLVKTAEDLKNLSDQQLMSAGQNPVVVPPYLVLAEMKRREQMRAEYAKATQQQGQQPTVAQQTAQSLMQGQPQPQQPQQPQPQGQGIMQAMPQGGAPVQAMAGGGQVGRYAEGGSSSASPLADISYIARQLEGLKVPVPAAPAPDMPTTMEEFSRLYPSTSIANKVASARALLGSPDYSQYEAYLQQQMQEARSKKPRLGDALIAAGAAMAANRDPRVGIANILAQGIGAGSESYRAQQEKQKKDLQTAMMAQMALNKMKQEDLGKQVELASQMASSERGENITKWQLLEHAKSTIFNKMATARNEAEKRNLEVQLKQIGLVEEALKQEMLHQREMTKLRAQGDISRDVARIGAAARVGPRVDPKVQQKMLAIRMGLAALSQEEKGLQDRQKTDRLSNRPAYNAEFARIAKQRASLMSEMAPFMGIESLDPTRPIAGMNEEQ